MLYSLNFKGLSYNILYTKLQKTEMNIFRKRKTHDNFILISRNYPAIPLFKTIKPFVVYSKEKNENYENIYLKVYKMKNRFDISSLELDFLRKNCISEYFTQNYDELLFEKTLSFNNDFSKDEKNTDFKLDLNVQKVRFSRDIILYKETILREFVILIDTMSDFDISDLTLNLSEISIGRKIFRFLSGIYYKDTFYRLHEYYKDEDCILRQENCITLSERYLFEEEEIIRKSLFFNLI